MYLVFGVFYQPYQVTIGTGPDLKQTLRPMGPSRIKR